MSKDFNIKLSLYVTGKVFEFVQDRKLLLNNDEVIQAVKTFCPGTGLVRVESEDGGLGQPVCRDYLVFDGVIRNQYHHAGSFPNE